MLVPVAEHDVAQEFPSRLHENILTTGNQAPSLPHCSIVEFWQQIPHRRDALVEGLQDLSAACRLRKVGKIWSWRWIVLYSAHDSAGNEGKMVGELAGRHGFLVRLARQLIFRQALQKFPRDRRLYFKLRKQ